MIFNVLYLSAVCFLALASVDGVAAAPSSFDYPEVIPGPGMPSLESLGLTSKDLYEGTALQSKRDLMTRFTRTCNNGCGQAPLSDAQACVNYLRNLGTQRCGVPSGQTTIVMCVAGSAAITGINNKGSGAVSSYCSDVAIGGQSVINGCTDANGYVEGEDAANGNGDLIVSINYRC